MALSRPPACLLLAFQRLLAPVDGGPRRLVAKTQVGRGFGHAVSQPVGALLETRDLLLGLRKRREPRFASRPQQAGSLDARPVGNHQYCKRRHRNEAEHDTAARVGGHAPPHRRNHRGNRKHDDRARNPRRGLDDLRDVLQRQVPLADERLGAFEPRLNLGHLGKRGTKPPDGAGIA